MSKLKKQFSVGDKIIIAVKVCAVTETEEDILYKVKPIDGASYNTLDIKQDHIKGFFEERIKTVVDKETSKLKGEEDG